MRTLLVAALVITTSCNQTEALEAKVADLEKQLATVNGRFMSGAMPIESFSALIDEELAKADARIAQGTPKRRYYQQWVLDEGLKSLTPP